ncbi:DUF3106 domain-containing protein [Janthinobacterium sp. 17J80-10]|uniref:DUF3106 domain-containing protein n=1 Tax=Janthinobacterium sp. 17J80-10 TaxID=2497863 RepID=UPI001005A7BC|nr:DUF3106 domain-containing protein [Janthinobacterium sp. 17J80-10]QAU34722.1 DUF3106 domain-containing protein [Janthinobacterium sp. 17J80-10]
MTMAAFQVFANPAVLLRGAGRMLGVIVLALLAACSRGEDPAGASPGATLPRGENTVLPAPQGPQSLAGKVSPTDKRPRWAELTLAQRQALAPLAAEWNDLDGIRKKKWLEIAARYAQMAPEEQQRLQTRMQEWTQLTPEQRRIARESYVRAKKLDAGQKSAKWEMYQNLPHEEKQKLVDKAERKKNVVNLPRPQADLSKPAATKPTPPVLPSAPTEMPVAPPPAAPLPTAPPGPATPANPAVPPVDALG